MRLGNLVESLVRRLGIKAKQGCGCRSRKIWLNNFPWGLLYTTIRIWNSWRYKRKSYSRKYLAKNPYLLAPPLSPERDLYRSKVLMEKKKSGTLK